MEGKVKWQILNWNLNPKKVPCIPLCPRDTLPCYKMFLASHVILFSIFAAEIQLLEKPLWLSRCTAEQQELDLGAVRAQSLRMWS